MRRLILTVAAMLALAMPAWGQSVEFRPAEVKIAPGRLAAISIEYEGEDLVWETPPALDVFREYDPDEKRVKLRVMGQTPGTYRFLAVTCKGGKLSKFAACTVTVTGAIPIPPVPPGPTPPVPPGPTPPPTPSTDPIGAGGFAVLISFDQANTTRPPAELSAFTGRKVLDYLEAKCVVDATRPGWKSYRVWPENTAGGPKLWSDALAVAQKNGKDWILIGTGTSGYSGPLPKSEAEMLALLKKFGG